MAPRDMTWDDVDAVHLLESCMLMEAAEDDTTASYGWETYGHSLIEPREFATEGCLSTLDAWDYAW